MIGFSSLFVADNSLALSHKAAAVVTCRSGCGILPQLAAGSRHHIRSGCGILPQSAAGSRHRGCRHVIAFRCALLLALTAFVTAPRAAAQDVSAPAILQWFEATYDTMERRSADMFLAGYGAVWIPPTNRAESGNLSVGYDVYDRFDLGSAGQPTLYGTQTGLRSVANVMHRFDGNVYADLVWNHNGFSDRDTPLFEAAGGYPGFVLSDATYTDGDFHSALDSGDLNGRLAGLIDIDHGTNIELIRQPVASGNPLNLPLGTTPDLAGRIANLPDPTNAQFYPDRDLAPIVLNDGSEIYPFNPNDPLAGDAVPENALGLLMRNAQWMVQVVGVDGFRVDAARHFEPWVMDYLDRAVFRASTRTNLDGSPFHAFSFSEAASTDREFVSSNYIRKDIDPGNLGEVGGNRDALDFAQFWPLVGNLTENGLNNDWNNVVYAGLDSYDDGLINGSAGVTFVESHDDFGPAMINVGYAYLLTRPGNSIVYYNADQFDHPDRAFPKDGRGDALGNYDDQITTLVNIRNTHGRGDYRERWLEKEYFAMERSGSMLVLLDNRNDGSVSGVKTMDVDFAIGTPLVELTGNAAAYNATSPAQTLDEVVVVQDVGGQAKVNVRFLNNDGKDQGYLIYGLQTPQSANGLEIQNTSQVLAGGTPDPGNVIENAVTRLSDLYVVTANQIDIRLETQAVTLPGGIRDQHADGDNAVLRVNGGIDTNGNGVVDYTTPGSVVYGFEEFNPADKSPGYTSADGNGWYQESIDATQLPEGYNFVTVRAFRHGVGGPAVFEDYKRVVYVDRLAPESEIVSFAPWGVAPEDLDLVVGSVDQTANSVHVFINVGAARSDAEIIGWATGGSNPASQIDRDQFKYGFFDVPEGNNVVTVVTFEITGNVNVQRFVGLSPDTNRGLGIGDIDHNGVFTPIDVGAFNAILYSQDSLFNPAGDVNADGLIDNRDLFALDDALLAGGASQITLDKYVETLRDRGDFNNTGTTDELDMILLYNTFGIPSWDRDLNVDGVVDEADVMTMVVEILRSAPGDFDLDGDVDGDDFLTWQTGFGAAAGAKFLDGDADLDGDVDGDDYLVWQANFGFETGPLVAGAGQGSAAVPEPEAALILGISTMGCGWLRRRSARKTFA